MAAITKTVNANHSNINEAFTPSSWKMPWTFIAERIQGLIFHFRYFNTPIDNPPEFEPYTADELKSLSQEPIKNSNIKKKDPERAESTENENIEGFENDFSSSFSSEFAALPPTWIKELQTRGLGSPTTTLKHFDALCSNHQDASYISNLLVSPPQQDKNSQLANLQRQISPAYNSPSLVFIPVVINKSWLPFSRNHIVLVTVDQTNKTIEYFDSFGISVNNRSETLLAADQCTIKDLIITVADVYFKNQEFNFRENTQVHQKDFHSCHIYVADRASKIAAAGGLVEQLPERLTTHDANQSKRIDILTNIFNWLKNKSVEERAHHM